jgi:dodecin
MGNAATSAIERASQSVRDLRIAEVQKLDIKLEDGKPAQFRANLRLSFKYQD